MTTMKKIDRRKKYMMMVDVETTLSERGWKTPLPMI